MEVELKVTESISKIKNYLEPSNSVPVSSTHRTATQLLTNHSAKLLSSIPYFGLPASEMLLKTTVRYVNLALFTINKQLPPPPYYNLWYQLAWNCMY